MGRTEDLASLEPGFRIGEWQVRPPAGELRRVRRWFGTRRTPSRHVEPKAMRVLLALAARPASFVSKDELIEEVWDGRPVTDDVLTGAICALRGALDDDARNPRYIETRSNVGYRLLPPVRREGAMQLPWAVAIGLPVLAITAILSGYWAREPAVKTPPVATIAVLPFLDLGEAGESTYLSAAMTEALILNLARVPDLRVISRTSVMPYADYGGPVAALAEELGAELLVEGSVQTVDGQLRVVAQLIEPFEDRHLWADDFDRPLDDVLALQQDISQAIATEIGVTLSAARQPSPVLPADDMHDYLLARYRLAESSQASTETARAAFQQLTERHPDFAPAHLGIAESLLFLFKQHALPEAALDEALASALRFERLAAPSAESHRCVGQILLLARWDFEGAERRYRSAIALNASDTVARARYAWLLVAMQRYPEAAAEIDHVRLLDPLLYASPEMANLLMYSGQFEAAVREFERLDRTTSLDPVVLRAMGVAYLAVGREAKSKETFVRMLLQDGQISGEEARRLLALPVDEVYRHILENNPFRSPIVAAGFHHLLGDDEAAISHLRLAVAGRDQHVVYLGALPEFAGLHDHPGFQDLLAEIGTISREPPQRRENQQISAILSNPQQNPQEY